MIDEAELRAGLAAADVTPLLMVLVHLSEEARWLDECAPHIHGAWNFMQQVPEPLKARLVDRLVEVLRDYQDSGRPLPALPPAHLLHRMLEVGVGQKVPPEYIPMLMEEMRLGEADPRSVPIAGPLPEGFRVGIVGAGLSGLCMAIKLREAGIPFVIFEKNPTIGGTWYENSYPGCGVDTPNHFFSFSFEPNHDWSRHFSKRDEIWAYLERVADRYDIRRHVRFGTEVTGADYDAAAACWRIGLSDGTVETVPVLVTAVGQLNRASVPAIPGAQDFAGPAFHTAHWDHGAALRGKRVAMIGTGASGMQAGPSIAPEVAQLTIFQRTPHWAVSNPNYHREVSEGKRWALHNLPFYAKWHRFQLFWASGDGLHASLHLDPDWPTPETSLNATNQGFRDMLVAHMRRELDDDPALLAKVVPPYPPYGKRMLRDNHWYRMLKQPNVALVTERIARISADAIHTADGQSHPADVLVYATGFQAGRMLWPMEIRGRDGVSLRDIWGDDDPRAYLGVTVPRFPNFFMLYGPNTNLGHGGSAIFHTECQVRYIMLALREMIERRLATLECRQQPHDAYNERVDAAHRRMVWSHGGVGNWYKNARGR
ncbi:MAG: flavin-containing monooxygenase, partial [Belnapia sp.]|nr:flavin-containing monooxygenase [Belnapia sp.]